MKRTATYRIIALIVCLLPWMAQGQSIRGFHLDTDVCSGERQTVTFGYRAGNNVEVAEREATLGHSERIFLPDGVECGGSCSYRSYVTFTDFEEGRRIASAGDIKYVRLNMEHSYIGDIYINITCPDGRKADIMRFAGSGTSSCDGTIPEEARGWLAGNNMSEGTFFGMPVDSENTSQPCDGNAAGNEPGTGWNYCWSSNHQSGFTYAAGDGIVYRASHMHDGAVDSSDVALKSNFYHPDQDFSLLTGCPLNGSWYIEVVDGYSIDNGYIFEWELALDASLMARCEAVEYRVTGGPVERVDDSTFVLLPPERWADTSIRYTFTVVTACGDTLDTSAVVNYHPAYSGDLDTTVCEGLLWGNRRYTRDTSFAFSGTTRYGCDSTGMLNLTVYPTYQTHLRDTVCAHPGLRFGDTVLRRSGRYERHDTTVHGCDSLLALHLLVLAEALEARINATPLVVTLDDPVVHLHDVSRNHVTRQWTLGGKVTDAVTLDYPYPTGLDSLPVHLVAFSLEGCTDTAREVVHIDRSMMTVPNVFTPDLESNKTWSAATHDVATLEVWVYSRQGHLVAHLQGVGDAWDGTTPDGRRCPEGCYVYRMRYTTKTQPEWTQNQSGTILLIR